MSNQEHIENLLKKFSECALSPEEARELNSFMKEGDDHIALKDYMKSSWQDSQNLSIEVPTGKILKKIHDGIAETSVLRNSEKKDNRVVWLSPFIKYAAVVLLTAGITWLFKDNQGSVFNQSLALDGNHLTEISVSYGSKSKITLPDGSTVNLNSGSKLRYPRQFDKNTRDVYLEGEAFFDVTKDPRHPFLVKTGNITIKVLGTRFNVKSYTDEKTIQTSLVSGSVEIYSNQKGQSLKSRLLVLKPNQQAIIEKSDNGPDIIGITNSNKNEVSQANKPVTIQPKFDISQVTAWKDNRLVFRDENFSELSRRLERWYDVVIEINDDQLKEAKFSGVFVKESVEQALEALKLATPFHFVMNKNHILITK